MKVNVPQLLEKRPENATRGEGAPMIWSHIANTAVVAIYLKNTLKMMLMFVQAHICVCVYLCVYGHPEVDRIRIA